MGGSGSSARVPTSGFDADATLTAVGAPAGENNICLTSVMVKSLSGPASLSTFGGACGVVHNR